MVTMWLFLSFAACLVVTVPIGASLGIAAVVAVHLSPKMQYTHVTQTMVTAIDSFPLMAVPFFILAGEIMGRGGISQRLLGTARAFFGSYTGGLGLVTVVACMFFAAISGSGPATVAAIGSLMIPSMISRGYSISYSGALVAAAGSIGVVIPPSIPMVVYSVAVGASIRDMFLAGFIPGILIGLALIATNYLIARKEGYGGEREHYTLKEKLAVTWDAKWSLLVPFIILGGIYGGVFTPTEAAAVAVIYGIVVGVFVYRDIKIPELYDIFRHAGLITATAMIIMGTASVFGRILTMEQIPGRVALFIASITESRFLILLMINILLLIVGCFMETLAAILILAPILVPVAEMIEVDKIHFGLVMIVNLAIGFITPPLGVNLFVAAGIAKISLEAICRSIVLPLVAMIIALTFITYIPGLSLWIPRLLAP
ncbi:MAG: TRAP transporter large permease [Planctomycetota bacterium]|jgi:C4-dicarboxylate transporter DctM subunit|nr:TRAP transporter large permease [Planctomycetota bacterium]